MFLLNCALSSADTYQTPLYDLKIDQEGEEISIYFNLSSHDVVNSIIIKS